MGEPKALLRIGEETFVDRLARVFGSLCSDVIVVTGDDSDRIEREMHRRIGCRMVRNPNPENGQLSSLQLGLKAVAEDPGGIFMIPVDCPGIEPSTIVQLQGAIGDSFVIPRYGHKHGHPIGFRSELASEFLDLDASRDTARTVVHRHRNTTVYVDVDDPAIHWDIDDRSEYRRTIGGVAL